MKSMGTDEKLIYENERGQSIELSVFSPFFLDNVLGLDGMKNSIYTTKVIGQDGETFLSDTTGKRSIDIQGRIIENKDVNRNLLLTIFNPKLGGRLTYINKNITRYIKCRVENAPTISRDANPQFVISLLCPNPFWYAKEFLTTMALWKSALRFPIVTPKNKGIVFGLKEPSLIVNINNNSDVECPMRIEFKAKGTLSNPSLFNVNTREFIKINKAMSAGDVISINTARGYERIELIKQGSKENIFNDLDIDSIFLKLNVGDNLLRYNADTNIDNLEVVVYHLPQFVGV